MLPFHFISCAKLVKLEVTMKAHCYLSRRKNCAISISQYMYYNADYVCILYLFSLVIRQNFLFVPIYLKFGEITIYNCWTLAIKTSLM